MEIKAVFGLLASFFVLLGAVPYLYDIKKGRAHPHVLSWTGWAFITALGGAAMIADGSKWAAAILFANTVLCLLIALYALLKRVGVWSTGTYDFIFFVLGITGLVLWQTLNLPILALICALIADFSFGLPTIIKTYKNPNSETSFVWSMATISGFLSLFALQNFSFTESAYPIYLFVFDGTVLLLTLELFKTNGSKILASNSSDSVTSPR